MPTCTVFRDLKGMKFGRWTALFVFDRGAKVRWLCRCDCGSVGTVISATLLNGMSSSCGCRRREVCAENIRRRFPPPTPEESERRNQNMLANKRAWRKKNPERAAAIRERSYAKTSRAYYALAARKRKALKMNAPGRGVTAQDWAEILELFGGKCAYCLTADATSMDHVVPITRGGAHDPENIVPACKSCNCSKNNKSLLRFVASGGGLV